MMVYGSNHMGAGGQQETKEPPPRETSNHPAGHMYSINRVLSCELPWFGELKEELGTAQSLFLLGQVFQAFLLKYQEAFLRPKGQ